MGDPWKVDGWVKCPACGKWDDAAAVFGDLSEFTRLPVTDPRARIEGLEDGLTGGCGMCGASIRVELKVVSDA